MTQDELLELIDTAVRKGWTELDLRYREIAELPSEIGRLTGLQKLAVGSASSDVWVAREHRNSLAVLPPEIGQLTQLRELDLCHNQLTALPPEIGKLTNLQSLDLRENQLTALPSEIGKLTKLQRLTVGRATRKHLWVSPEDRNPLTLLPPEIGQLTQLREFDLSWNQLTTVPPEIGKLTNLQSLELRGNQLTTIPTEIGKLTSLQSLELRGNQLTTLPPEIGQLRSLQSLGLSVYHHEVGNRLTDIPPEIGKLTSLQSLELRGNQLTTLPPEIGQLRSLEFLDLGSNQLTTIPPETGQLRSLQSLDLQSNRLTAVPSQIGQLRSLQWLNLQSNRLTTVPPEISQLKNLQTLYLSHNPLTTVPSEIGQLSSLQRLGLEGNQLTAVPPEIGQLISLQSLDLGNNQLTIVPPPIGQLRSLESLDLGSNQLTIVPPEIGQLRSLEFLNLDRNQLTAVPPEIGQLRSLEFLNLDRNQLMAVPPEIGHLASLQILNLSRNQLATLPKALRRLEKLEKLHLYDNPLPLPPELLGSYVDPGKPQLILDAYFRASRPLHEAKLLLVGEGSVGKTSLVERLLYNRPPSDSGKTVGVDIRKWELGMMNDERKTEEDDSFSIPHSSLRINVWDFGGQEIYHATHQFFLTHRSLYLVVIEARKDEVANRLDYWLRHVNSFAGDAPIILVVNKSDQGRLALDERGLMLKYPAIRAIVHTSCVSGAGLPQLRQAIEEALAAMPHINDWIPLTWFEVKEQLAALDKDTLLYENYVELCQAAGIEHEAAQRTLARFLHDLGAALNFQDDRRLAGTHVLNPEWVTGGIYRILNAEKLQENGFLRLHDLDDILDRHRYPPEKHPFLLDIMGKFELCVSLFGGIRYLIPGLLPKTQPTFEWPDSGSVTLEYRYAILPAAILSRLMVRLHSHVWYAASGEPTRWRNGLVIHSDGCRALVAADPAANRLTIALDGPAPQRRRLLAIVRAELAEIHASFAQLEAEEWVPIPEKPGKTIPYQALLNLEARGTDKYYDAANDLEIDVYALLDGIEAPDERKTRPLQQQLVKHFSMSELKQLCFELGVDHEMWPDKGKPTFARNLVLYFLRQGRLGVLEKKMREERPYFGDP